MPNPTPIGSRQSARSSPTIRAPRRRSIASAAGHAGHRDEIDEAAGLAHHGAGRGSWSLVGASRKMTSSPAARAGCQQLVGLVGRQIDDQQPSIPARCASVDQPRRAVVEDRVVVAEQDDRRRVPCPGAARPPARGSGAATSDAPAPEPGALNHRAVGGRIRERHPSSMRSAPASAASSNSARVTSRSGSPAMMNGTSAASLARAAGAADTSACISAHQRLACALRSVTPR